MEIAICIPTYKRKELLSKLLDSIERQDLSTEAKKSLTVIVIDNDEKKSASWVLENKAYSFNLVYVSEPRKGLATVRNRAIKEAMKFAEYILFVDDDEWVVPNWVNSMLETCTSYNADVVSGPVVPVYPDGVSDWIVKGGFFERKRFTTGQDSGVTRTGNILFKTSVLKEQESLFAEELNLIGGEDSHFLTRLYRQGKKMVWCDEAVAYEPVPEERATISWLKLRFFRIGCTGVIYRNMIDSSIKNKMLSLSKTILLIVISITILPAVFIPKKRIQWVLQWEKVKGRIKAHTGGVYNEYQ